MEQRSEHDVCEFEKICHYCQKKGHLKRDCFALKSRHKQSGALVNPKPAMCAAPVAEQVADISGGELKQQVCNPGLESYLLFIRDGFMSLGEDNKQVRVKVLHDTAAFDSFVLASALPFSDETDTGTLIPVLGMGMTIFQVPQHKMMLSCEFFQGEVAVVVHALPLEGTQMILGNDIAESRMWKDAPDTADVAQGPVGESGPGKNDAASPVLAPTPLVGGELDSSVREFPEVFAACAVTCAMARAQGVWTDQSISLKRGHGATRGCDLY